MAPGVTGVSVGHAMPAGCHEVLWCAGVNTPPAPLLVARRSGVLSCVLGWVGQQFPEAPGQLPLVKDLGVQVHPARGVQTPQTLPRR